MLSAEGEVLAYGHLSPESRIRVRLLCFGKELPAPGFLEERIEAAVARRSAVGLIGETDAVRLVNAEGDGLPGLIVDRYADLVVVKLGSAGMAMRREKVAAALRCATGAAAGFELIDKVERVVVGRGGAQRVAEGVDVGAEGDEAETVVAPEVVEAIAKGIAGLLHLLAAHRAGGVEHEDDVLRLDPAFIDLNGRIDHEHEVAGAVAVGPVCQQRRADVAGVEAVVEHELASVEPLVEHLV